MTIELISRAEQTLTFRQLPHGFIFIDNQINQIHITLIEMQSINGLSVLVIVGGA